MEKERRQREIGNERRKTGGFFFKKEEKERKASFPFNIEEAKEGKRKQRRARERKGREP